MSDNEFDEAAAEAYLMAQRPPAGSGITGILAAADKIEARIVEAEKTHAALAEIKRLHAPMVMPIDNHLLLLCDHCCFDDAGQQTDDCANSHEHSVDGPACHTAEIIAKAGL
jgi:hypothetical protein